MSTQHRDLDTPPDPRRWKALALLCTAFFMVILDSAIVVVALPSIDADLAFSAADLQWVLSVYMLSFGGLLLLGGRASDLLGRPRMFIVGTGLFPLASLGAGLGGPTGAIAGTAAWLIGGPITSGLGWEWIFFINVPVAGAVAVLSPLLLGE